MPSPDRTVSIAQPTGPIAQAWWKAVSELNDQRLTDLLKMGADHAWVDDHGQRAMDHLVDVPVHQQLRARDAVRALCAAGDDPAHASGVVQSSPLAMVLFNPTSSKAVLSAMIHGRPWSSSEDDTVSGWVMAEALKKRPYLVRTLLQKGVNANVRYNVGPVVDVLVRPRVLTIALSLAPVNVLQEMLDAGAALKPQDVEKHGGVFHQAVRAKRRTGELPTVFVRRRSDILTLLHERGHRMNAEETETLLDTAVLADVDISLLPLLVQLGANPHGKNANGGTALHVACMRSDRHDFVASLLALGLDPLALDKAGATPIDKVRSNANDAGPVIVMLEEEVLRTTVASMATLTITRPRSRL